MADPEFFAVLTGWIFYVALVGAVVGHLLWAVVAGFALWVGRRIRMRSLREPFAVRAKRMEDLRVRLLLSVDRICERNAREAARRG
ncbi:hypothetical protein [Variovorax sp. Varisp36]|uniref:hypothetical protein n=1 Tax=Variovorax sp. Varisp36 TaxID=3243031 RepID=UPI0039A4ADF6